MGLDVVTLGMANAAAKRAITGSLIRTAGRTFNVTKYASNPVITSADSPFAAILWPWVLKVGSTYRLYYSSDHDEAAGGIALATSPGRYGPWTQQGIIYEDLTSGAQTETPCVFRLDDGRYVLMYQQLNPAGTVSAQVTLAATSPNGIDTWTRVGPAADIPNINKYPSPAHTGYFRAYRVGAQYRGFSLLKGAKYPQYAQWNSRDGLHWSIDPRPLGTGHEWVDETRHIQWSNSAIFWLDGHPWVAIVVSTFTNAYDEARTATIAVAPISPDHRNLLAAPVNLIVGDVAWENTYVGGFSLLQEADTLTIYYRAGPAGAGSFGVATVSVT